MRSNISGKMTEMNRARAGGYQSRGGYPSQGGNYQAQGGYNAQPGYQDQGANYLDQGENYQDQGANYQDQGGYNDQGGYQNREAYQDQGETYSGDYQDLGYQEQGGSYEAQGGGYQAQGVSGIGLLGEGPRSGGQSPMKSMSLGMKRMTGDGGWSGSGAGRDRMAGAGAGNRQAATGAGLLGNRPQQPQARKQQQQQQRGRMQETEAIHQPRERQLYRGDSQQLDLRKSYTNEQDAYSYGSDSVSTQRGLLDTPAMPRGPEYSGRAMEQPTGNSGYFESDQYEAPAPVQQRGPGREPQMRQSRANAGTEYETRAPRASRFSDNTSAPGRYRDNMGGGGRGLLDEPPSQGGLMNRRGSGQGQATGQDRGMMNRQRMGQGVGVGRGQGVSAMQQDRGGGGGARMERRSGEQIGAMLARRDRQMELMEKAEVQLKMIQESNKQKVQLLERERMQQQEALALQQQEALALQQREALAQQQQEALAQQQQEALAQQQQEALAQQQQEALAQQQLMMQAQLQQQQQQMKRRRPMRTPNDGLLGEGPGMGGGRAPMGNIPSIFDVPTKQTMRSGLGKRPASSGGLRFGDNKKPRQKLGENRDRSNWRDQEKSSRRDGYDQRRNRSTSNSRDRKDSETRRSSDHTRKTPDKSSRVTTPKTTPKDANKARSDAKKGKDEGRGADSKKDPEGNTTQVTVEMTSEYDPAQPTPDTDEVIILDDDSPSDNAQKKNEARKTDEAAKSENKADEKSSDMKHLEGTALEGKPSEGKPSEGKSLEGKSSEGEGEKPMEISLTVTVNKKGRSVNDKDRAGEEKQKREKKYKCNVCNIDCYDEPSFSRHMNGMKHRKNMELVMSGQVPDTAAILGSRKQAEQHLRQIEGKWRGGKSSKPSQGPGKTMETFCKVCDKKFTGAYKDHKEAPEHKTREDRRMAGCKLCKVTSFNSYTDFTKHEQSQWHLKQCSSARLWPECKLCNQRFKSPRKFVRHCKTDHHIENKEKRKSGEDEEMEELVTLDTVGFEEDQKNTEMSEQKAKEIEAKPVLLTSTPKPTSNLEVTKPAGSPITEEIMEIPKEHDPKVAVGVSFVKSVTGFFCKLCHKFYNNETSARVAHCQSKNHFDKYKKYMQSRASQRKLENDDTFTKPNDATKPADDVKPNTDKKPVKTEKKDIPQVNGGTGPEDMDTGADNSQADIEAESKAEMDADNSQADSKVDNSQSDTEADNSQADTKADNSQEAEGGDNQSHLEVGYDTSQGEQSKVEASAYETADEHRDSTVNITMSFDSEEATPDTTKSEEGASTGTTGKGEEGEVMIVEATATEERKTAAGKKGTPQRAKRGRGTARRGRKI